MMKFNQLFLKYLAGILLAGITLVFSACSDNDVADPKKPKITVNTFSVGDDEKLVADIDFSDNVGLQSFTLVSADLDINETQTISGTTHNFRKEYDLTGVESGTYTVEITVVDVTTNILSTTEEVIISARATGDYNGDVFLIGDLAWFGANPSLAMPMEKDEDDPKWYEITLFSPGGAESGVKFIGQRTEEPNNWGLKDGNNPDQGMINSLESEEIPVTEEGYHTIRFNPSTLDYEITAVDPATLPEPLGQMHVMGAGFVGHDLNWNLDGAIPMNQDENNPYLYSIELEFSDKVDLKFNANKAWDEHDCGFPQNEPPSGNALYVELACGGGTADYKYVDRAGTYIIVMDEYLRRASIVEKTQ